MVQVDKTAGETHILVWRIENISRCPLVPGHKIESIESIAGNLYNTRWRLVIYPIGRVDASKHLSIFIRREDDKNVGPETLHVEFHFSLVTLDGVHTYQKTAAEEFNTGDSIGFSEFAKLQDILNLKEFLLPHDTLTVSCKIRLLNPKRKQTSLQKFVTEIPIEKISMGLTLGDFRSIRKEDPEVVDLRGSKDLLSLRVSMNNNETSENGEGSENFTNSKESFLHVVMVKRKSVDPVRVWCSFKLLDEKKEIALENNFSHLFSRLAEVWVLPYFLDTSRLDESCIEDGNRLNFEVDFIVSDVREQCRQTADLTPLKFKPYSKETTLIEDLGNFLKNSEYHDVILRIGDDTFRVHKSFLASRSPRFEEIFLCSLGNVTDNQNQIQEVIITDVDKKTMELMLQFIYTDQLEDMDNESCLLLFAAAHKYQIRSLVFKCMSILRNQLSADQICKVFLVAEQHGDLELKMLALVYILEHYEEILAEPELKELSKKHKILNDQVWSRIRIKMQLNQEE